jgi:hypothetical protein
VPPLGLLVELPQRVTVGGECLARQVEDLGEDLLDAEASQQRRGRLEQASQPLDLLGGVLRIRKPAFDVLRRQEPPRGGRNPRLTLLRKFSLEKAWFPCPNHSNRVLSEHTGLR